MIVMKCPGCKTRFEFAADLAGKKIKCKSCGDVFRVEDSDAVPKPSKVVSRPAARDDTDDRPPVKSRRRDDDEDDDRRAARSRRRDDEDDRPVRARRRDDDEDDRRGRSRDESDDELPRRKRVNPFVIIGPIAGVLLVAGLVFLLIHVLGNKKTGSGGDGEVAKGVAKIITLDVPAKDVHQLVVPDSGNQFGLLRNESPDAFRKKWVYEPYDLAAGRRVGKVDLPDVKEPIAVTVSPDGKYLMVTEKPGFGDRDHTLTVYSVPDAKCLTPQKWQPFPRDDKRPFDTPTLYRADFVANDRILTVGSTRAYHIFTVPSFDPVKSDTVQSVGEHLNQSSGRMPKDWEQRDYRIAFAPDRKRWAVWTGDAYAVLDAEGVEQFRTPSVLQMARTVWPRDPFVEKNVRGGGVAFSPDGKVLAGFLQTWGIEKDWILCRWDATASQLPETVRMPPTQHNEAAGLRFWGNRYLVLSGMTVDFRDLEPAALDTKTGLLMKQVMMPQYRKAVFARDGRLWYAVSDESEEPAKLVVVNPAEPDLMEEGTGQYEELPNLRGSFLKRLWMEPGGVFKLPKRHAPPLTSGLIRQP